MTWKRLIAALLTVFALNGVVGAVGSYSDRHEAVGRAIRLIDEGAANGGNAKYAEALRILADLHDQDFGEHVECSAFRAGRINQGRDDVQDFSVDCRDGQVRMRELYLHEIGDPAELGFGRMGPDGAEYNHDSPEEVPPGTPLGLLYWRIWEANEGGWQRRMAQVWARYTGNNSGSLHFAVSKDGELIERLKIDENGMLDFQNVPTQPASGGQIRVAVLVDGQPFWMLLQPR